MSDNENFERIRELIIEQCEQELPQKTKDALVSLLLQSHETFCKNQNEQRQNTWNKAADTQNLMFKSVFDYGLNALRTAALVSGAALAAITGFLPNLEIIIGHDIPQETVEIIAGFFCAALLAAVIASGSAYIAQCYYAWQSQSYDTSWEHPFVIEQKDAKRFKKSGDRWNCVTFICIGEVYGLVAFGFIHLMSTFL